MGKELIIHPLLPMKDLDVDPSNMATAKELGLVFASISEREE